MLKNLCKLFAAVVVGLALALVPVLAPAAASATTPVGTASQITYETAYVGPFNVPTEWRNDTTIKTLLSNFYRPLALSNISSPEGHQGKFQYLAFYFCFPLFTPQQCFDNNDSIGNAVVLLPVKPLAAPTPEAPFDPSAVEFNEELTVWFPATPQGSTRCVSMDPWGSLPFLAFTRRGLTDLRPALAIDEQPLQTITTIDTANWIPDAPQGSFTWRCSSLQ